MKKLLFLTVLALGSMNLIASDADTKVSSDKTKEVCFTQDIKKGTYKVSLKRGAWRTANSKDTEVGVVNDTGEKIVLSPALLGGKCGDKTSGTLETATAS